MKKILLISLLAIVSLSGFAQTYDELVSRAMDYTEKEDYVAAEQAFKTALRKEPGNPGNSLLFVNLGTVQRHLGKNDEALVSYNVALENHPDIPFILHNRASLYCEMNRLGDALQDYNIILKQSPDDVEALYRRALIYMTNKLPAAAKDDFDKICSIDKNSVKGKSGLALLMKRNGEWQGAEEVYTDLIYNNKNNAELYFNRAECYLQLRKLARTQEDLTKAAELGYDDAPLYIMRGQLRLAQYDKRSAKDDFLMAQEKGADPELVNEFLRLCK